MGPGSLWGANYPGSGTAEARRESIWPLSWPLLSSRGASPGVHLASHGLSLGLSWLQGIHLASHGLSRGLPWPIIGLTLAYY